MTAMLHSYGTEKKNGVERRIDDKENMKYLNFKSVELRHCQTI